MTNVNCYWLGSILRELEVNTTKNRNNTHSEGPMGDRGTNSRDPIGQFLHQSSWNKTPFYWVFLMRAVLQNLIILLTIRVLYLNKNPRWMVGKSNKNTNQMKNERFNYFLSCIFPESLDGSKLKKKKQFDRS